MFCPSSRIYIAKYQLCHFDSLVLYYGFIIRDFQKNRYRIIVRKGGVFSRFSRLFSFLLQIIAIPFFTLQTGKKFSELFCTIFRYFYGNRARNHYLLIIFQKSNHLFLDNLFYLTPSQQESDNFHSLQNIYPSYFLYFMLVFRQNSKYSAYFPSFYLIYKQAFSQDVKSSSKRSVVYYIKREKGVAL